MTARSVPLPDTMALLPSPATRLPTDVLLSGIIVECPHTKGPSDGCPMTVVREEPLAERFRWMEALGSTERQAVVERCLACFRIR
jgi:hypothetical protein